MLCLQLQSNAASWKPFLQPLWPTSVDVFSRMEQDMIQTVEEIKANISRVEQFHQQLMQEMNIEENKILPMVVSSDIKSTEGGFVLCLGVQDFCPEELTVKVLGRKLLVTGAKETKNQDGKGSYSYKCQIFRKETDLPQEVKAEDISCTLTTEGQLRIEAPWKTMRAVEERTVPIQLSAPQGTDQKDNANESKDNKE
ncbi:PREDICTED: heat shock protein beta-11-like [Nanorana parkeri]|uniref:heat shock protein beta-11-like n=1 Tax=Nanorana parkeri TaxID=125878 RepID=UPI00085428F9|nr:PREDICTED: heat shock protein beta-11-like [Nanorana parkeri]